MLRDLKSLNRQKYQRKLNRIVRRFNKMIEDDWLWNGRFVMRQYCAQFKPFDDHSGAIFEFILELKDNKTGRVERMLFDNFNAEWYIGQWANECVVKTWNVWEENPNPNEQARLEGRTPPEKY